VVLSGRSGGLRRGAPPLLARVIANIAPVRDTPLKKGLLLWLVPFALPAAGLPVTRGGYVLAVKAEHFLATSAVTADALFFVKATAA
jgi:hypothetical protein